MITRDAGAFFAFARDCAPDARGATPRAAFLVAPDRFVRADESAHDNRYMADAAAFDGGLARAQHRGLQARMAAVLPTVCFPGADDTPDAVFPNNVFATVPGRSIIGRMHHPVRRREATRADIRGFLRDLLGYQEIDLSDQPHPCELTGALVIDRARGLGFCGLSLRCDEAGARRMHAAFGLRATLMFDLAPGEYHTNVVLAVLAGRAALVCRDGFADPGVADAITAFYPYGIPLSPQQKAAFSGNAIALSADTVWMSAGGAQALDTSAYRTLAAAGFRIEAVALDAIEAAGGSLRCCVAEIY